MSNIPSDPRFQQGVEGPRGTPRSSDELLPPVEPPSAGFLLQLFVVPGVIVACVVLIWFAMESLARSGEQDPAAIVRGLRSPNGFQQAKDLADMLRVPQRYPELRSSHELAGGVATYLDELIDAESEEENAVTMRYFLVTLLGEMEVDDGVPVLVKAARGDPNRDVRRKAVNALAVLGGTLANRNPPQFLTSDELAEALVALANDEDQLVRSEAAFAIGVIGAAPDADSRLIETLGTLAEDPYTDARFNAAVALARVKSPLAPKAVAEMLDPESIAASALGEKPIIEGQTETALRSQQLYKRDTILTSALTAVDMLVRDGAQLEQIEAALERLLAAAPSIESPGPLPQQLIDAVQRSLAKVRAARASGGN